MSDRALPASLAFLLLTCLAVCAYSAEYSFSVIDFPDAAGTMVFGVNDRDEVVGVYGDLTGANSLNVGNKGFLYDGTTFQTIDVPDALATAAQGVNDQRHIVGNYLSPLREIRGFLFDGTTYLDIAPDNAVFTDPKDINNSGQIVGSFFEGLLFHGFEFDGTGYSTFDFPDASITFIAGNNNRNEQVGLFEIITPTSGSGGGFHRPSLTKIVHPRMQLLSGLADINDDGQTVGTYIRELVAGVGMARHFAFVHSIPDGSFVDIDLPGGDCFFSFDPNVVAAPESCVRSVQGINSRGTIVGYNDNDDGQFHGFIGRLPIQLQPGDADQDLDFDQFDVLRVLVGGKYLSGQAATWGEGDWDGAPGGLPGNPPAGDGLFNQQDIVAALAGAHYLLGPYAALRGQGGEGDGHLSGGRGMGDVDVVYIPEPATMLLAVLGALAFAWPVCGRRKQSGPCEDW